MKLGLCPARLQRTSTAIKIINWVLHFLLGPCDFLNNVNADCNLQEKINTTCMRHEISDHRNVIFSYRLFCYQDMWLGQLEYTSGLISNLAFINWPIFYLPNGFCAFFFLCLCSLVISEGKYHNIGSENQSKSPAGPLTNWVTLGKLFNLPEPQFSSLWIGGRNSLFTWL